MKLKGPEAQDFSAEAMTGFKFKNSLTRSRRYQNRKIDEERTGTKTQRSDELTGLQTQDPNEEELTGSKIPELTYEERTGLKLRIHG